MSEGGRPILSMFLRFTSV